MATKNNEKGKERKEKSKLTSNRQFFARSVVIYFKIGMSPTKYICILFTTNLLF